MQLVPAMVASKVLAALAVCIPAVFAAGTWTATTTAAKWKEPADWEDAVQHRRRRQAVRFYPQDAEAGFYQPYYGIEPPEFVAQAVPAHMYTYDQIRQSPALPQPFAPPAPYQKEYSVYPYQPPELYTEGLHADSLRSHYSLDGGR